MSEVTDIPLLIRKHCIIKKGRVKLATGRTINQVPVTLSIYVLYLCTQEMPSFHFQIITLKNSHFEFLPSMSQF